MKNINSYRKFDKNTEPVNEEGDYVLYWMQINRRFEYNYALEYAIAWANKLNKPLLVYEGLSINYPWASDRFHSFLMEGMKENALFAREQDLNYYSYLEPKTGAGKGLIYQLAERVCAIISDEFPVFIMRTNNEHVSQKVKIAYITVDSNGIIPLGITEKAPYSAYLFRRTMQQHFLEGFTNPPKKNPISALENRTVISLPEEFLEKYPPIEKELDDIPKTIAGLDINHQVKALELKGTRKAALERLSEFTTNDLLDYDEKRNHPDEKKTSGLSPWLHFGKISEYEIVKAALAEQPEDWDLNSLTPNGGKNAGFFNGNASIESFMDEVITWREVGFHFAHHTPNYDAFESLPDWAIKSMEKHSDDVREYVYSLEELEFSRTHDELWNAAQTQLREQGIIHNYLRMLWGKKVIEWTPNHRTALEYLIELNNKYAIDGRDPNSYSGIFWCFGRFDRAWQERHVFGKLRYMTSDSARKKIKLTQYLQEFGSQKSLL